MSLKGQKLGEQIKHAGSVSQPDDGGRFWDDFRARASLTTQEVPEATVLRPISLWSAGLALAIVLILVGVIVLPLGTEVMATEVQSIDVMAEHSAVMILAGDEDRGTVVWIEGMSINNSSGSLP